MAATHANTPTRTVLDHLGRSFQTVEHNGLDGNQDPILYDTTIEFDIEGNGLVVTDARGNTAEERTFAPGGLQLKTEDPQDRLQKTGHLGGGDVYYVYDSAGMRVRKVCVHQNATTSKERFYLGPWETYRERTDLQGTPTLDLERETLHVEDAAGAACLIETKTVANGAVVVNPTSHLRYQHTNHLGTATLELTGAAEVISYEEYHPYGTSAYRAANSSVDVSAMRHFWNFLNDPTGSDFQPTVFAIARRPCARDRGHQTAGAALLLRLHDANRHARDNRLDPSTSGSGAADDGKDLSISRQ